nr:response regulator [Candidatus Acidoferrales bacterium]
MTETAARESSKDLSPDSGIIPLRILVLEDDPRDVTLLLEALTQSGFVVRADTVDTERDFVAKFESQSYDLILSDYRIPSWSGAQAFRLVKASGIDVPFILVTGTLGDEAAVDLIKEGVTDYILKDRLTRLPTAVRRALAERAIRIQGAQTVRDLRISEARIMCLVESSIVAIAISDLRGNLIEANGAFSNLLGYSKEEVRSGDLRFHDLTPPEFYEADRISSERLKRTGVAPAWEKEFIHKNGSHVAVLIGVSTLIGTQGAPERVAFIVDISEKKKLEMQLRKAQKMEAIGQLAGGIAHDFNNHLSVIIGFSEVLLGRPAADDQMRSQCEQIKKAGERAASLTRQLLAFSRQQVLAPKILDLNHVVLETEKMLARLIGEHIELSTNLDSPLGSVRADPGQIEQIIINLAVNARDAMPQGGKLVIKTGNVELDEEFALQHQPCISGRYVLLTVSDTGTGMDELTIAHMFEPFFTTKEVGKGTGLGLSTVYGVVKQSGGYVWVDSKIGRGSTFKIYLPRVDEIVQQRPSNGSARELFQGTETVLLVEDEDSVRKLTRTFLDDEGYKVIEANGGAQALEIAANSTEPIHILLTDVVMPVMNGRALAQKMLALRPEMKILYVSGYAGGFESHGQILEDGAIVVPKPFSRKSLLGKLREVLDS